MRRERGELLCTSDNSEISPMYIETQVSNITFIVRIQTDVRIVIIYSHCGDTGGSGQIAELTCHISAGTAVRSNGLRTRNRDRRLIRKEVRRPSCRTVVIGNRKFMDYRQSGQLRKSKSGRVIP